MYLISRVKVYQKVADLLSNVC